MPRRARLTLPGAPTHLIQRGNNRQACFFHQEDYQAYLTWLAEYAELTHCQVHAFVLMTNHVHLLITPATEHSTASLMHRLGQRYVQYINRTYRRSGTLWEGRFKSCLTQEEDYVLGCYRYIEMNPVRAQMVEHPSEYRWSSFRANAQGESTKLITPHPLYRALGANADERLQHYRELFRYQLDPGLVDQIREATNGGYALGSERFQQQISNTLGRRAFKAKAGRPPKQQSNDPPPNLDLFD